MTDVHAPAAGELEEIRKRADKHYEIAERSLGLDNRILFLDANRDRNKLLAYIASLEGRVASLHEQSDALERELNSVRGYEHVPSILARFFQKITMPTDVEGCWLWTGEIDRHGYGHMKNERGIVRLSHIWGYEHFVGKVPDGLELDHLCRVRNCVNPQHLEPVTHLENMRRSPFGKMNPNLTHCPKGHSYSGVNLKLSKTPNGKFARVCRACTRMRGLARPKRKQKSSALLRDEKEKAG